MHEDGVGVAAAQDHVGGTEPQMQGTGESAAPDHPQRAAGAQAQRSQSLPKRKVAMDGRDRGIVTGEKVDQGGHGDGAFVAWD